MLIIVGIAHSAAPLGIVEIVCAIDFFHGQHEFNLNGSEANRVAGSAIIALCGQIVMLIASLFSKLLKRLLTIAGLAILYVSFFILVVDTAPLTFDTFSLLFGIPFLYASVRLILNLLKERIARTNSQRR